jgi:hypothetical protein
MFRFRKNRLVDLAVLQTPIMHQGVSNGLVGIFQCHKLCLHHSDMRFSPTTQNNIYIWGQIENFRRFSAVACCMISREKLVVFGPHRGLKGLPLKLHAEN